MYKYFRYVELHFLRQICSFVYLSLLYRPLEHTLGDSRFWITGFIFYDRSHSGNLGAPEDVYARKQKLLSKLIHKTVPGLCSVVVFQAFFTVPSFPASSRDFNSFVTFAESPWQLNISWLIVSNLMLLGWILKFI